MDEGARDKRGVNAKSWHCHEYERRTDGDDRTVVMGRGRMVLAAAIVSVGDVDYPLTSSGTKL